MKNKFIDSKNNREYKKYQSLSKRKYREKEQLFLVEGLKLTMEAEKVGLLEKVITKEGVPIHLNAPTIYLSNSLFAKLSTQGNPEGIMGLCAMAKEKPLGKKILYLEEIRDPGNLGTMIRSAEAFGFSVMISKNSVDLYHEKTLRGSMGSVFRVPIKTQCDREDLLALKKKFYKIYATDLQGEILRSMKFETPFVLVIGSESHGVKKESLDLANSTIKIPMEGKVESLNAATSASLLMFYSQLEP
ncbi:MAG: RNA methyltransferase [Tissierellia bacterium]|nr:RNA methyltransferase [Tissierellia bacterium]